MDRYPNISEHGLIGDLQTAALVTSDGTVDFFCCPRFDSPSVFASLLDADRGGYFSIKPAADGYVTRQLYLPNTAMLITRFMTPDGVGEVLDFMPVIEGKPTDRHRLVRYLRVARGTMRFEMEIQPRFDYGRAKHTIEVNEAGAVFRTDGGMHLTVHTSGTRRDAADGGAVIEQDGRRAARHLHLARGRERPRRGARIHGRRAASRCRRRSSTGWPTTRRRTGSGGWAARRTQDGGGRWSAAPR